ncbi:tryptophan halogenase family protein [Parvularcula oceani]|uniref:tryptophan halogenase family protein n=1 Tax=Parvularcula oceani TaxID=1247963 RepID=UPI0004E2754D|nr:tryptophan halogenase family protein [Parvularcula oceani]
MHENARARDGVREVSIIGGGTAGWMTAAALARLIAPLGVKVRLIESDAIGTVGVGEATLPHIRFFNERLGIDEAEFMAATQATIKLGIEFRGWGREGDSYIHPFGDYGREAGGVAFHQLWRRLHAEGKAGRICDYSLPVVMAEQDRFAPPAADPRSVMSSFSYAYQMDATLYARFLRAFAEGLGVERVEGRIVDAALVPDTDHVDHVILEDGRRIGGDLFVDCSGFRGLLIEGALKAGYEDWSDVLPCDRAVAVPCDSAGPPSPYTRATARKAGWQWRIPLQHRLGNGYVYCSDHIGDQEAADDLLSCLDAAPQAEPRFLRFRTGRRRRQWVGNTVALGLSAGFLEPLESTSIYLIQAGITTLVELFPEGPVDPLDAAEFDRVMALEYERVRDFLVLHYFATERDDSPFWDRVRTMAIPDSLSHKMELFRRRGSVVQYKDGLFLEPSWLAVYLGQRVVPEGHDPLADRMPLDKAERYLAELRSQIRRTVDALPRHEDFLKRHCPAAAA